MMTVLIKLLGSIFNSGIYMPEYVQRRFVFRISFVIVVVFFSILPNSAH